MSGAITVELPGAPPSESVIGGVWSRAAVREAVEPWRLGLVDALRDECLPERVSADVTLHFTDRRHRTVANWNQVLRRLLIDALGADRLAELTVKMARGKRARTKVKLSEAIT